MSRVIAVCSVCDHSNIREKNTAYAELWVLDWDIDEKTGLLQPNEYDTDVSADWEVMDTDKQYVCGDCGAEFNIAELKSREEEDE